MKIFLNLSCCIVLWGFFCSDAFAFYCQNKIIGKGMSKGEVKSWCGEPTFEDRRREDRIEDLKNKKEKAIITVTVDEWMYNFGSNSFTRILIFENGVLTEIKTGDYGWSTSSERKGQCDSSALSMGASKSELVLKCGEPHEKNAWERTYLLDKSVASKRRKGIQSYEEWIYKTDAGKRSVFKFENGKLFGVRTGD